MTGTRDAFLAMAAGRTLRRVTAALALYRLAEFGPWVAMLVFAYSRGGAAATGLVSLGLLAPTAVFAPLAGPLIDRFGASRVLLGGYTAQAATMALTAVSMLVGAPALVTYCLGALTAMVLTITHPAHAVCSPGIAHSTEQLVALNAVTGWILSVGLVVAPACAGLILAVSEPGAVYAAGAVCVALAAVLVVPLRDLVPPLARDDETEPGAIGQLVEGARALAQSGPSREVVLVLVATFMMVGAFDVLAVVLAVGTLDIGGSGAGYLTAAHGVGAVLGAVISFAVVARARLVPVMLSAALIAGIAFLALALETTLLVAFGVAAVAGISRSMLEVSGQTLLQRVTPTALLARVFAFKEGLAMAAWGAGSIAVPAVIAISGERGAVAFAGAVVPLLMLLRLRPLLAVDAAVTIPAVTCALLRSMHVFRAMPVPALEGVAQGSTTLNVAAGHDIIRQGEPGDRYYAVADGVVEVRKSGLLVNTLGRGEGFGETALLHDTPRNATVAARTPATLVVVEREPFLVALTGHAPTRERLEQVASQRDGSAPGREPA